MTTATSRHQESEPERRLRAAVERVLAAHVDRFLDSHGGAVHVAKVTGNDVELRFDGACTSCPAVSATFYSAVLPAIKGIPEIGNVSTPNVNVSGAAVTRILQLTRRRPSPPQHTPEEEQ